MDCIRAIVRCLATLLALSLFIRGFLPIKRPLPGSSSRFIYPPVTEPAYNRTIWVVVDALRGDFIFGGKGCEDWPYVCSLIKNDMASGYEAKAHSPTVTMPRIKASYPYRHSIWWLLYIQPVLRLVCLRLSLVLSNMLFQITLGIIIQSCPGPNTEANFLYRW